MCWKRSKQTTRFFFDWCAEFSWCCYDEFFRLLDESKTIRLGSFYAESFVHNKTPYKIQPHPENTTHDYRNRNVVSITSAPFVRCVLFNFNGGFSTLHQNQNGPNCNPFTHSTAVAILFVEWARRRTLKWGK